MGGIFSSIVALRARTETKEQRSNKFLSFIHSIRNWHLLLVLLPLLFIAATLLRFDHLRMVDLRQAVLTADETGNEEELTTALLELRHFTTRHIVVNFIEKNGSEELIFGTGPFYLEGQYNRKATAAIAEAERRLAEMSPEDGSINSGVFIDAINACRVQNQLYGWTAFINCFNNVAASFPSSEALSPSTITADIPSTALYRYDFASPIWYPCLSGWVVLLCLVLIAVILIRALYWLILQIALYIVK